MIQYKQYYDRNLDFGRLEELLDYEPVKDLRTFLSFLEPEKEEFVIIVGHKNTKKYYWSIINNAVVHNNFLYEPIKRFLLEISENSDNAYLENVIDKGLDKVNEHELKENTSDDTRQELSYLADLLMELESVFNDLYETVRDTTLIEIINLIHQYDNRVDMKSDLPYRVEQLYLDVVETFVKELEDFFSYDVIFYQDNVDFLKETLINVYLDRIPYFNKRR